MEQKDNVKPREPVRMDCILVCLYFACLPLTAVSTPYGSLLKVVTFPIAALLGLRLLLGGAELTLNSVHFFYALYVLYTVASLAAYHTEQSTVTARDMVWGLLMLLLVSVRSFYPRELEWMESACLLAGLVCIICALRSNEALNEMENRVVVRVLGYAVDQNYFCATLIMPVLVSAKRFLARRRGYPLYLLVILLAVYAILKTGSRGGLIGVLCGLLAYLLLGVKTPRQWAAAVAALAAAALAVCAVLLPALPEDVQLRYTAASVLESGATGRFQIWHYLLRYTLRSPVRTAFGSGLLSTYEILYGAGFSNGVAHNTLIQVFSDQGLAGLLLYLMFTAACLLRTVRRQPLYACAFLAVMALSMSLTFYEFKPYLNILMLCALSAERSPDACTRPFAG